MRTFHGEPRGIAGEFINRSDPGEVLTAYRQAVCKFRGYAEKVSAPVNQKTGKPLKKATVAQYRSALNCWRVRSAELKMAIRYMVEQGHLGNATAEDETVRLRREVERKDAMISSQADVIASLRESIQSQRRHIRTLVGRIERLQQGLAEPPEPVKKGNVIYLKRRGVTMQR